MDTVVTLHRPADPAFERFRRRALALYDLPFNDLLFEAHAVHRKKRNRRINPAAKSERFAAAAQFSM